MKQTLYFCTFVNLCVVFYNSTTRLVNQFRFALTCCIQILLENTVIFVLSLFTNTAQLGEHLRFRVAYAFEAPKRINSADAINLKLIGIMKMQYVTIYPNIYECVSDYIKIYQDRF